MVVLKTLFNIFFFANQRSWSRSPSLPSGSNITSKRGNVPIGIQQRHGDRSPPASPPSASQRADQFSRFERSRAALEQLVNEDRSRREAMRRGSATGRPGSGDDFQSPPCRFTFPVYLNFEASWTCMLVTI